MSSPRFAVGIDLGTTNSAVAWVDTTPKAPQVRDFAVPQLVGPATVEARDTLPSFHYEAAAGEFAAGALCLPWDTAEPRYAVGFFARDHGAAVPGRLVTSAKSWLCHSGVNRAAALLPWHGAPDVGRLSPVDASARYLGHIRRAWNHAFPGHPLETQDVVLTVPASFDEVARELTVEAATQAGLARVVLLEEPQAAFYAWICGQGAAWQRRVHVGERILVCDVGGGTSDFTLISVEPGGTEKVRFHRVAVGEHLILGGDNLDLALAHHLETRVAGAGQLEPRVWGTLVRTCRQVKETLLGPAPPEQLTVNVAAGGARLIGGSRQVVATRAEVEDLLVEGFLPRVALDAQPATRRSGFQEFGLPYAPDPAITRYLAAFLTAHAAGGTARPDIVLMNGGLFASPVLRARLLEVLGSWFPAAGRSKKKDSIKVLDNDRLDLAVARGAAYYGLVRRGQGVRISGGLAQAYYVGVAAAGGEPRAVCLLPAGVEEGQGADLTERTFELLIRQPVEFPLYVSSTRTTDAPGAVVAVDARELTSLPPIRTVLQSGRKGAADRVRVQLHARRTEIGTLDLWCSEVSQDRRWRLQFDVRVAARPAARAGAAAGAGGARGTGDPGGACGVVTEAQGLPDPEVVAACDGLIRATFRGDATHAPEGLVKRLEQAAGQGRHDWSAVFLRGLWEVLLEVAGGRGLGVGHEARWLSLTGFALRPGFGVAVDDWRVAQTWRLFSARVVHRHNELCRAEWWILWRRIAGGLTEGQQQTVAQPLLAALRDRVLFEAGGKGGPDGHQREPAFQFGAHETAEVWRLLASLELLPLAAKLELGRMALALVGSERPAAVRQACLWAVGRLGARVPLYGPLNAQVPVETVEEWARRLLAAEAGADAELTLFALVHLTRRTGDRYRDVSPELRAAVLRWLAARAAPLRAIELVEQGARLEAEEERQVFGESLPSGLRLEGA